MDRWRKLFAEVGAQLDEIEGKAVHRWRRQDDDKPDREAQQGELAASGAVVRFQSGEPLIALTWKNLARGDGQLLPHGPRVFCSAAARS